MAPAYEKCPDRPRSRKLFDLDEETTVGSQIKWKNRDQARTKRFSIYIIYRVFLFAQRNVAARFYLAVFYSVFCLAGFNFSAFLPVKVHRIGNEVKFIPNSQQRRETSLFEGIWTMVVVETVCDSSLLFSYVGGQNM